MRKTSVVYLSPLPVARTTGFSMPVHTSEPYVVPRVRISPTTFHHRSPSSNVSPTASRFLPVSSPSVDAPPSPTQHWRYSRPSGPFAPGATELDVNQRPPGS